MKNLKTITIDEIRLWGPCYDPLEKLPEGWSGTALNILEMHHISFPDKLWVLMRNDIVSDKLMRLFAVWCARQVEHLMKDQRSVDALNVAERFANGNASRNELDAARYAAQDAARYAAWAAARDAAWDAARAAAWDAARYAAWDAARDAARAAARAAAWDAARAAAQDAQKQKLKEMILAGIETGDSVCEVQE